MAGSWAGQAHAGNVNYGVPTPPGPFVQPSPGWSLPAPPRVPGKEFTTKPNSNFAGNPALGQSMAWDGLGGTANLFQYGHEVDALAAPFDALFPEVLTNNTNLLLSFEGDLGNRSIYAINPAGIISLWASSDTVKSPAAMGGSRIEPFDLNGLEVWGPELVMDATNFSPQYDLHCSVLNTAANCLIDRNELAAAIGRPDLASAIDLDGLMSYGSDLLFSIQPVDGFDGGEIWQYTIGSGPGQAAFLQFGGQTWNTAFNLQAYFSAQGYAIGTENIDALEAASVPGPLPILGAGVFMGYAKRLRRMSGAIKASARG
jgi:hypothetical protein